MSRRSGNKMENAAKALAEARKRSRLDDYSDDEVIGMSQTF